MVYMQLLRIKSKRLFALVKHIMHVRRDVYEVLLFYHDVHVMTQLFHMYQLDTLCFCCVVITA